MRHSSKFPCPLLMETDMPWYLSTPMLTALLSLLLTLGLFSIVSAVREQSFVGRLTLCGIGACALFVAFNI